MSAVDTPWLTWDAAAAGDDDLSQLVYGSRLLGADRSIVNFGGGNTSVKTMATDHAGREGHVLWVKASGSDLATVTASSFSGLRLDDIAPLEERSSMSDEEMVDYLVRCQLHPSMPRPSIETLLHAFVPAPHVDHTHPDTINAIAGAKDGQAIAASLFGHDAIWIPYRRPGFDLAKIVAAGLRAQPAARWVILAKHGLVAWGDTAEESYRSTQEAVQRAGELVSSKRPRRQLPPKPATSVLPDVLPAIRGELARGGPAKIVNVDASPAVLSFLASENAEEISQVGAACPDHLVHTKRRAVWVPFDPERDTTDDLRQRCVDAIRSFRSAEAEYVSGCGGDSLAVDTNPRIMLIQNVGLVSAGTSHARALLSRDLYHRAIAVMEGAASLGGFVSLDDAESFAVEYWPLELYKLSLAPPPRELEGRVALITGGAGGIGAAIASNLSTLGACVVLADLDDTGARERAEALGLDAIGVEANVTDEESVRRAFDAAVLEFGGLDIVVSNAGIASSAPIEETTVELWTRNHDVLVKGYFLVAREAARVMRLQAGEGSIVFIGSKNGLVAGRNVTAYSSAKAAELHLARCLAEELGPDGIRVNTVNPDAVLSGSKIWSSTWREERARAYGIAPDQLEEHYRVRTTLGVNVLPEDIAKAVAFFASEARSAKSTGNVLNVDGGSPTAYPR